MHCNSVQENCEFLSFCEHQPAQTLAPWFPPEGQSWWEAVIQVSGETEKSPYTQKFRVSRCETVMVSVFAYFPFWRKCPQANGQFATHIDGWTFWTNFSVSKWWNIRFGKDLKVIWLKHLEPTVGIPSTSFCVIIYLPSLYHTMEQLLLTENSF